MEIILTQQEIDIIESNQDCKTIGWEIIEKRPTSIHAFNTFYCTFNTDSATAAYSIGKIVAFQQSINTKILG